jgi:hypothetical protein
MKFKPVIICALITIVFTASVTIAFSQGANAPVRTSSKILYHNGQVLTGIQDVYFIYYGCWANTCGASSNATVTTVLSDFASTVGNTPYLQTNSTYIQSDGQPASSSIVYGGAVYDNSYRHGFDLTASDIAAIIDDHIGDPSGQTNDLPVDPQGIYIVAASADVASTSTGFCTPGAPPYHDFYYLFQSLPVPYIFLGNGDRCRGVMQFPAPGGVTPNGNFAADAMTFNLAHALHGLLTDPYGTGWYDRYGLENSDKCTGNFGTTYTTANGAWANLRIAQRDFLLEQNWVNDRKGRCAMAP